VTMGIRKNKERKLKLVNIGNKMGELKILI
jgi:hypothetical protein